MITGKHTPSVLAAGCLIVCIALSGCDSSSFSRCSAGPDVFDEDIQVWAVGVDGSNRRVVFDDWINPSIVSDGLMGVSVTADTVFVTHGYSNANVSLLLPAAGRIRPLYAEEGIAAFALSPSRNRYVFIRNGVELWLAATDGTPPTKLAEGHYLRRPIWVSDSLIAYERYASYSSSGGEVLTLDLADGTTEQILDISTHGFAISRNGATLAFASGDSLYVKHSTDSAGRAVAPGRDPRLTPDGIHLAYFVGEPVSKHRQLRLATLGGSLNQLLAEGSIDGPLLIDSDGQFLIARVDDEIRRIDIPVGTATVLARIGDHPTIGRYENWQQRLSFGDIVLANDDSTIYYLLTNDLYSGGGSC
ncbi:MAG: hypothetical protein KDD65_07635 [Bacteroidetes bacterium]|nr:hypothetical protein [Bacteroidota bacterium]